MEPLEKFAELLSKSKKTVVLTGAGMSTESGIPDFRSVKGIYREIPEEVLSLSYFLENVRDFYSLLQKFMDHREVLPNIGHEILATWESRGMVHQIITQNVDGLHQKGGSKKVLEIHGSLETASCIKCKKQYPFYEILDNKKYFCDCQEHNNFPIKPDVVLYEEEVPLYNNAISMVSNCDLLLILGTSLSVYPVARLLHFTPKSCPIVIINNSSTPFDRDKNTIAIHKPIGETLTQVDSLLGDI